MTPIKKILSLITFVTFIFFSMTHGALCEETPSALENARQETVQTPPAPAPTLAEGIEQTPWTLEEFLSPTANQQMEFPCLPSKEILKPEAEQTQEQQPIPLSKSEKMKQAGKQVGKRAGKIADAVHRTLSNRIINSASWLDSFFANERSLAEENRSNIRLRYNLFLEESSDLSSQPGMGARLVLPTLEKKAHIILSADPDEPLYKTKTFTEDTDNPQVVMDTPKTTISDKRRFTTALQYFLESTEEQSISIRTGLRFSNLTPAVFAAPRYRLLIPLNSWNFRFTQEVMYRTDTKWQETTRFDFERPLDPYFFRATTEGAWFEDTQGYFYSLKFSLFHPLGPKNALTYEWVNSFETAPTGKLTDIALRARYRQSIWRDWIFFEIAPQCRFPSDRDQQFTPGILFGLEAVFGTSE